MRYGKPLLFGLLASTALSASVAQERAPAPSPDEAAQPQEAELEEDELDADEEIVVTGQRQRGAVIGDIPPEVQLNRREIRALGAGNLAELLDALAPQTRSGRGRGEGGPVVLLNGRRISGFGEIRNIPPEAIERVDILPEEVALKYGYRADQRVVNFVLRRRFRAITAELEAGVPTAGGRSSYEADVNMLRINRDGRTSIDAEYERSTALFESERNIIRDETDFLVDDSRYRTLLSETDQVSINGTVNRTVIGDASATLNGRFEASSSQGFLGLRSNGGTDPLTRSSDSLTGHLGAVINSGVAPWRWSLTANYDRSGTDSITERNGPSDIAETVSESADAQIVANGSPLDLPAGEVSATMRIGGDVRSLESESLRGGVAQSRDLSRQRGAAQANVDIPIASRRRGVLAAIGELSFNANAEVEHLSDFGTLRTLGGGFNWSPVEEINLIASYTDEDGAPSMQQLGDPLVQTPNVRVFDFVRGETIDITRLDGGNPNLTADNRRVLKLGLNARPLEETDLSITANYTRTRTDNPIASFPTATPEIEAAFPDRFVRNAQGRLVQIDSRPVNFTRSDREEFRWGLNFSKSLGPEPPAGGVRRQFGPGGQGGAGAGQQGRAGGPRGGPGGGFGRFGGPPGGSRLQLSLYHSWHLKDEVLIREGVPELDFLGGSAAGNRGGRPEHEIELQAGLFKDGFGARLTGNWQSGTTVRGVQGRAASTDLFFSDFTTANLRLFADLGQQRSLVREHPWLRGMRVSLVVDNLFDSRLQVRDAAGATPLSYQPAYLDPLGRAVRVSLRKLFF